MQKNFAQQQREVSRTKRHQPKVLDAAPTLRYPEPTPDFLSQLQERFAISEVAAVEKLGSWLLSYEPGELALARAGVRVEPREPKQNIAA